MMGGRGMRDARLARHRAQRQAGEPVTLQHPFGGLEQRLAQRAMVIGRLGLDARRSSRGTRRRARLF